VAERVLSIRELNRALLARQLLLQRVKLSPARALERVGGLQTQYAPTGYIGLWSRLHDFRREALTRALEQRRVVQATLMRVTIHLVSAADYPLMAEGLRHGRRAWWMSVQRHQMEALDMEKVAAALRKALAEGPRRQKELTEILKTKGFPLPAAWSGAGLWLDLIRVPPSGTWDNRRADLYALADDELGRTKATEAAGLELLVERYFGGFGPASLNDLAGWAGLPAATLRPVVDRLRMRRFRDERGGELLDLPRQPLPDPDSSAPPRFLSTWEAALLVHARRTQVLPEDYRPLVFNTKTPHSVPTFLVDGAVAGTWRYEKGKVRLEPFAPLPRPVRREVEDEAAALAAFHAA
jgi:Winged helix DNA-binding domain